MTICKLLLISLPQITMKVFTQWFSINQECYSFFSYGKHLRPDIHRLPNQTLITGTVLRPHWQIARGTDNQYWRLYWHNTGMIKLYQYSLESTGWVLPVSINQYWALRTFFYWLTSTRAVLASQYWARSFFSQ